MLLAQIREELEPPGQDDEDVRQDFFVRMLEGRWSFVPGRHRALAWMKANVRAMARGEDR